MADEEENEDQEVAFFGEYNGERNERKQRHGQGTATLPNGDRYRGQYSRNLRDGQGTYVFKSGSRYEGSWRCGVKHGRGKFTYSDGSTYDGFWIKDKRHGFGTYNYQNSDVYMGQWKDNERSGYGVYLFKDSQSRYIGFWQNGRRHGKGELLFGAYKFSGNFQKDTPVGLGRFIFLGGYEQQGHFIPFQSDVRPDPPAAHGNQFSEDEPDWPDSIPDVTTTWIAEKVVPSKNPGRPIKPEELVAKLDGGTTEVPKAVEQVPGQEGTEAPEDVEARLLNAKSGTHESVTVDQTVLTRARLIAS